MLINVVFIKDMCQVGLINMWEFLVILCYNIEGIENDR